MLWFIANKDSYFSLLLKLLTLTSTFKSNKLFQTHYDFDKNAGGIL
jgi:hypothetical protein